MKRLIHLLIITTLCILPLACKHHNKHADDGEESDSTLINDASMPTEEEIDDIMDTAKQEKKPEIREELKGLHIYVSKTTMHLYVLDANDSVLFTCGIACGLRRGNKQAYGDYKTPEGDFHISGMFNSTDWIHRTKDGRAVKGCYGPHFLRLSTGRFGGIGIHGTNSPRSIGHRASEGCIRMQSNNIITLFNNYAYNGMPVTVSAEGAPLPPFKGMVKKEENADKKEQKDSMEVEKQHAVPHNNDHPEPDAPHHKDTHTSKKQHYDVDSLFN